MSEALRADGFNNAILGVCTHFSHEVVIYDYEKCVSILMNRDGMTDEDAREHMEYNVCGAWVGENTPVFLREFESNHD